MTIKLFIVLFTIGSAISSLLTEALKKSFKNLSSNFIALVDSVIVGFAGTMCAYVWLGIEITLANILAALAMTLCVWIGSMVGYDKVMQTLGQIRS